MNARAEPVAAEKYALEISRVFDAPPILVFKAFTKPEHMVRWWGPKNFTTTVQKLEFREGGSYRFTIHGPNNTHRMSGVFREIVEPSKIMFTFAWDDEKRRTRQGEPDHDYDRAGRREGPADVPAGAFRHCRNARLARRRLGRGARQAGALPQRFSRLNWRNQRSGAARQPLRAEGSKR